MKAPNSLIGHIRGRMIYRNQNWLCLITGGTGTGKSFSALRLAEVIDPKFKIERCVWTTEQFLDVLNNHKLRKGSIIIWDEAGVGVPSREWYSMSNKAINYVMQTFRYKNLGVIMTTPSLKYIDSGIRSLFHSHIQTLRIDRKEKKVIAKFYWLVHTNYSKDPYRYFERFKDENGNPYSLDPLKIGKPSKELIDAYEKRKDEYCTKLNEDLAQDLKAKNVEEKRDKMTDNDMVKEILKNEAKFRHTDSRWEGQFHTSRIAGWFGVSMARASRVKQALEMKKKKEKKHPKT